MRDRRKTLTWVITWLVVLLPTANAVDFTKPGPFSVGVKEIAIPSVTGQLPLVTTAWYPAAAAVGDAAATILRATKDAPPAKTGPFPLVIVIHGIGEGGVGTAYAPLGKHLASFGFVVAASDYDFGLHDPPAAGLNAADQTATWLLYHRPSEVVRVISYAETLTAPDGELAGVIDVSRVGVWGHSSGGTTALLAGGAQIDFKALDSWCAVHGGEEAAIDTCQFVGHEKPVATLYGLEDPLAGLMPPIWDKRVAALVLAAPGGELHAFGDAGIAPVAMPTLIMFAPDDSTVKPEYNAIWAYDGISSQDKTIARFDKGGHLMFMGYGRRPDQAKALAAAFFIDILKDEPAGKAALPPNELSFAGLTYRTTRE